MRASVVGVHGVGNRRSGGAAAASEHLGKRWGDSLAAGLSKAGFEFSGSVEVAYYADDLMSEVGQGIDDPELLPVSAKEALFRWAVALGAPVEVAQGRATRPIRALLDWVARKYGYDQKLVSKFVARLFREVSAYLDDGVSARRLAARNRVAEFIRVRRPRLVIAHSLGSVVAYEALCAHPELQVEALLTLGSPLGMPDVVYHRLDPVADGKRRRPAGLGSWDNVADHGDLVAIPVSGLKPLFDVDRDHEVSAGLFDFHRVSGYLGSRKTASIVADLLGLRSQPGSA